MRKIINGLIRSLLNSKVFGKNYRITYCGKGVSLNQYYTAKHWTTRAKLKNTYKDIFVDLLSKSDIAPMTKFVIVLFFNSRHDTNNVIGLEKIFSDTLKEQGYIVDDNKKFYRGLMIFPDEDLKMNTFEFNVFTYGDKK